MRQILRGLRGVHAWVGAAAALFLAVIGATGATCAFMPEIVRATLPAGLEPSKDPASFGQALSRFQAGDPRAVHFAVFDANGQGVHRLFLAGGADLFIDGQGAVVERTSRPEELLLDLHQELLLGRPGKLFVGAVGVTGLLLAATGLVVWFTGRPRLGTLPRSLARRELLATHRDWSGLIAALLLLQAATGAATIFTEPFRALLGGGSGQPAPAAPASAGPPDWPAILRTARSARPGAEVRSVGWSGAPDSAYEVGMRQPTDVSPGGETVVYVSAGGALLGARDGASRPAGDRIVDLLVGLHTGAWLGPVAKPVLVLTGGGLTILSLLGLLAFLQRWRRA